MPQILTVQTDVRRKRFFVNLPVTIPDDFTIRLQGSDEETDFEIPLIYIDNFKAAELRTDTESGGIRFNWLAGRVIPTENETFNFFRFKKKGFSYKGKRLYFDTPYLNINKYYLHQQSDAADTWIVTHNFGALGLGEVQNTYVTDLNGEPFWGALHSTIDQNSFSLHFTKPEGMGNVNELTGFVHVS